MPPKPKLKGSENAAGSKGWEQELSLANFCETGVWNASIAVVVESTVNDSDNIAALNSAISKGVRKLFTYISGDELYKLASELGGSGAAAKSQKGKAKETHQNAAVCEACMAYIDHGEEIPLPLLAYLIKFRLLMAKDADQQRRQLEMKNNSSKDMMKGGKGDKSAGHKSPAKGGKSAAGGAQKKGQEAAPKTESTLKKRGELEQEINYINDEPDDGPELYIVMNGFYHPHLLTFLAEIGITVDCIIRVESETLGNSCEPAGDEEALKLKLRSQELEKFWRDILPIMNQAPESSSLHDIARLSYCIGPQNLNMTSDDSADIKTVIGSTIFNHISSLLYNLSDAKRHWKNYLSSMKLYPIPSVAALAPHLDTNVNSTTVTVSGAATDVQPSPSAVSVVPPSSPARLADSIDNNAKITIPGATRQVDMRYYNELMNSVPLESTSVPLIMYSMVEQVCASEENRQPPNEVPGVSRADGLDGSLAQHLSNVVFRLSLSDEQRMTLCNDFDVPLSESSQSDPPKTRIINVHDELNRRLFHLKNSDNLNMIEAELEMLGYTSLCREVFNELEASGCARASFDRAARLQTLLHFISCQGVFNKDEIAHVMNQFVFECMDTATVDTEGHLEQSLKTAMQNDIPWDDPYPYYCGMISACDDNAQHSDTSISCSDPSTTKLDSSDHLLIVNGSSPMSRSHSGSILKRNGSSGSRRNVSSAGNSDKVVDDVDDAHSVKFQDTDNGNSDEVIDQWNRESSTDGISDQIHPQQPDLMTIVNNARKRNLDPWCFAEHMEPTVLLQVMLKTLETHSFVDVYKHKQDHSVLVIMHNPQHDVTHHSHDSWQVQLHSNVRFRNYLEYVAGTIVEWIQQEEAGYQASLLAAEVEKLRNEELNLSQQSADDKGGKGRQRSKSPKKNDKTSRSPSASPERPASSTGNPFIRAGSIKAWKEEQERARAEQEAEEKIAEEKKSTKEKGSPRQKTGETDGKVKAEVGGPSKDKKKNEATKSGSKTPDESNKSPGDVATTEELTQATDTYWPFVGYDMGSGLVHVSGTGSKMFPSDGGQIHTERIQFVHGSTNIRATLLKDGHTFNVHILDPQRDLSPSPLNEDHSAEGQSHEQSSDQNISASPVTEHGEGDATNCASVVKTNNKRGIGRFGSFTAQLSDGMTFAVSTYGPDGEPADGKPYEPEPYKIPEPRSPSPVAAKDAGKGKGTKDKGDKKDKEKIPEPVPIVEEVKVEVVESLHKPQVVPVPFQQLYVSCPDGLAVNFYTDSVTNAGEELSEGCLVSLLVRQSYPLKTRGSQSCEAARRQAMEECSRVITNDGTVIKTMNDGTTQVLFADGTVKELRANSPLLSAHLTHLPEPVEVTTKTVSSPALVNRKSKFSMVQSKTDVDLLTVAGDTVNTSGCTNEKEKQYWITTLPSGERTAKRCSDGTEVCVPKSNVVITSDPQTSQVMHNRDDHVISVFYPDGTTVVEHADGTRITCVRKQSEIVQVENQEDGTACCATVEYITKLILVECKGFATVRFDSESGLCTTEFGSSGATVDCLPIDGGSYAVFPSSEGSQAYGAKSCLRIDTDGTAGYFPGMMPTGESTGGYYIMRHFDDVVMETLDTNGYHYFVTRNGDNHIGIKDDSCINLGNKEPGIGDEVLDRPECTTPLPPVNVDVERPQTPLHTDSCAAQTSRPIEQYGEHTPRLFVVKSDGGYQLLRQQDICEYLMAAERDPRSVVLTEHLPDSANVVCITVLRSGSFTVSDQWLRPYIHDSIIPCGLRTVCIPPRTIRAENELTEGYTSAHRFASNVGKGLDIGVLQHSKNSLSTSPHCTLERPAVLEVRQLLQFSPVIEQTRSSMEAGLKAYADHIKQQMQSAQDSAVLDPRSVTEQSLAYATLTEFLQTQRPLPLESDIGELYTKAISNGYVHTPPQSPVLPRKKADLEKVRRELEEEKDCRRALSERLVPPYFNSDIHSLFSSKQVLDKNALKEQVWGNASCEQEKPTDTEFAGVSMVGCNAELDDEPESKEPDKEAIVINEAFLPRSEEPQPQNSRKEMASNTHVKVDGVTGSRGLNDSKLANAGDSAKCDEAVNKSANSNIGASESSNVLPGHFGWKDGGGENASLTGDQTAVQPAMECQTVNRWQHNSEQADDVQFTIAPMSGKLAEFMSSEPEELPKFVTSLNDSDKVGESFAEHRSNINNSNENLNNSSDLVVNREESERLNHQQYESKVLDTEDPSSARQQGTEDPTAYQLDTEDPPDHQPGTKDSSACQPGTEDLSAHQLDTAVPSHHAVVPDSKVPAKVTRSRVLNVTGGPRNEPVRVPPYLQSIGRPGATPNTKFGEVEEPVRRKVNNTSVTAATANGIEVLSQMRGLAVQPEQVDFGVLKEGCTYSFNLKLKNTGIDSCRFRIRQPPPSTGIKVLYTPGPIAAGLKTDVQVEIFAIAAGVKGDRGIGCIVHNLQITTETDYLLIPISATVLTASEFDNRSSDSPRGFKAPGVKLLSTKAPSGVGAIRPPRRSQDIQESVLVN